jgi:hypothetical protein
VLASYVTSQADRIFHTENLSLFAQSAASPPTDAWASLMTPCFHQARPLLSPSFTALSSTKPAFLSPSSFVFPSIVSIRRQCHGRLFCLFALHHFVVGRHNGGQNRHRWNGRSCQMSQENLISRCKCMLISSGFSTAIKETRLGCRNASFRSPFRK